jgi:glycerol-3-phosphate dehydrogenase (NAD(P)+)
MTGEKNMKVAVLGAGAFGTALTQVFSENAAHVELWTRNLNTAQHINDYHRNPERFASFLLSSKVRASTHLGHVLRDADLVVSALPMKALRTTFTACQEHLSPSAIIVSASKGIEPDTLFFPNQIFAQTLPNVDESRIAFLSGPNFASEIIRGLPWAAVVASKAPDTVALVQTCMKSLNLRVYASTDVIGVELGGAIKNVFAIAAGIVDGLELGFNARAALMTRALSEMSRFATALGAEQKTIYGLSGLGDLLLSCTSSLSRNWRVGQGLALGRNLDEIQKEMGEVAEGVGTTSAAAGLVRQLKLDAPICEAVNSVLFEGVPVKTAMMNVMGRPAREE